MYFGAAVALFGLAFILHIFSKHFWRNKETSSQRWKGFIDDFVRLTCLVALSYVLLGLYHALRLLLS